MIINGAILAAMGFGLCAWMLYKGHEEASHYAIETSQNITLIAQRDITRSIETLSLSLDALANRYQNALFPELTYNQQHSYLFGSTIAAKHIVVMAVLDKAGKVVVSSRPGKPLHTYGDRPYFTIQRDQPEQGLYISRPISPKFDKDLHVVVLSKRLSNQDGSFAGIVVMALDLAYFRELFSGIELGENGVMSLYSRDGILYMRLPYSAPVIGRDISSSPFFSQWNPLMQQESGSVSVCTVNDGVERLYAFRRIPETQLVIFVGRSEKDIYKHWNDNLYTMGSIMFLFFIVCLMLFHMLRKELKKRHDVEEKLSQLARIDGLTNLFNRRALDDMLRNLWSKTMRSNGKFSILFIDVDCFKFYNDTYGHQKGDDVLIAVSGVITSQLLRSSDFAARYGGEEFIVVLAETDAQGAIFLAEKIRNAIQALDIFHPKSQYGCITVSIGAATYEQNIHNSIDTVLSAADGALYKAKATGRNNVQLSGLE